MYRDPSILAFIKEELETSPLTEAENTFLTLLLVDNPKFDECHFMHRFLRFFRGKDKYLEKTAAFAWGEVNAAKDLAGLEEISAKLGRALELLYTGCSLKPIEDRPELWRWSEELEVYYHVKNRRYTRENLCAGIRADSEIHHFPSKDFHHWQGYGRTEEIFQHDYLLDPFKSPLNYYYTRHWDGKDDLVQYLRTGPRELPEGVCEREWLAAQRERKGIPDRDYNTIFARPLTQGSAVL